MAANKPFANLDKLSKLATPQPMPFTPKIIQGSQKINIGFPEKINLEDRLQQNKLDTTTHLAQYYLSDQFTDIITIKQSTALNQKISEELRNNQKAVNQGGVVIKPILFEPNQGSVQIATPIENSLIKQGTTSFQGVFSSLIDVKKTKTLLQTISNQGTYTTNQTTFSFTEPSTPQPVDQGFSIIKTIQPQVNQGTVRINTATSVAAVEIKQGIKKFNQKTTSNIQPPPPAAIEVRVPYSFLLKPSEVVEVPFVPSSIVVLNAEASNAFIDPQQNEPIQTLGYLADKGLASLLPTLKHGSQDARNKGSITKNGTTPHSIVHAASSLRNSILLEEDGEYLDTLNPAGINKIPSDVSGEKTGFTPGINNNKTTTQTKNAIKVLSGVYDDSQTRAAIQALAKEDQGLQDYRTLQNPDDAEDRHYRTVQFIQQTDGFQTNPNILIGEALAAEGDEGLNIIRSRVNFNKQKGSVYRKEKAGWNNGGGRRKYAEINDYAQLEKVVDSKRLNPTSTNIEEYSVTIASTTGVTISFTAFLTSFSDSFTANWTDYNHVGQMDTFKVYKGATRQISTAFKVVAGLGDSAFSNTPASVDKAIESLNNLVNATIVGKYNGNYVEGPIVTLTIAGVVQNIKCAINSVKIDTDVAETGWSSGKPHIYAISLDATALANKDDVLFSQDAKYLG